MSHTVSMKSVTEQNLAFPKADFSAKDIHVSMALREDKKRPEHGEERSKFTEGKAEISDISVHLSTKVLCKEESPLREVLDLTKSPQNVENDEALFYSNENTNLLDNYSSASYVVPPAITTSSLLISVTDKAESDFVPDSMLPFSDIQTHSPSSLTPLLQNLSYGNRSREKSLNSEVLKTVNPFEESYLKQVPKTKSKDASISWSVQIPETFPKPSVLFPDGVWEDSESLGSSIGTDL
jgi:hypothetical protein